MLVAKIPAEPGTPDGLMPVIPEPVEVQSADLVEMQERWLVCRRENYRLRAELQMMMDEGELTRESVNRILNIDYGDPINPMVVAMKAERVNYERLISPAGIHSPT